MVVMHRISFIFLLLLMFASLGCQSPVEEISPEPVLPEPAPPVVEEPPEVIPEKEVIEQEFDIPPLVGKTFMEIKEILGEPTSNWEATQLQEEKFDMSSTATYKQEKFELQLDYFKNKVTEMFLCAQGGARDFDEFLKAGNLVASASEAYLLREVKALPDPSKYTCVEIIHRNK